MAICGIAGLWRRDGRVPSGEVKAMLSVLTHRGPDDEGWFSESGIALGMRRLAVRDVARGRQPYRSEDDQVVAVFNGELYNYDELAARVTAHGHRLASRADGEVLVHLYEMSGSDMVRDLRGMFAFALWDRGRRRLFLARDQVGQKPLYLWETADAVGFTSELKAFAAMPGFSVDIEPDLLAAYLGHRYVPGPETLVRGVTRLGPGEAWIMDHGFCRKWSYWEPRIHSVSAGGSLDRAAHDLDELLQDTVSSHLDADVPLGIFLSGGLDSSLLAALASGRTSRPIRAWVAYFPGRDPDYDESERAREVAKRFGLELRTVDVEWAATPDRLRELAYSLDEPMADPTVLPLDGVARAASAEETVMLSGEGADEIFAGYAGYGEVDSLRRLSRIPARWRRWWIARGWPGAGGLERSLRPVADRYRGVGFTFHPREQASLLRPEFRRHDRTTAVASYWEQARELPDLQAMQGFDVRWFLSDDVLHKADRIGMRHHLEIRVPYCDVRVVEFALELPLQFRRGRGEDKRILRRVANIHLPRTIATRPKQGFPTPLTDLLNESLSGWVWDVLTDGDAITREWLLPREVARLLTHLGPGQGTVARQVYALLMLELWAQEMSARRDVHMGNRAEGSVLADPPVPVR